MTFKLYADTFKIALSVNPADKNAWKHLYGNLCSLREALACRFCRKLINIPIRLITSEYQHINLCKSCVVRKKGLKSRRCDSCSDCQNYEENIQLRILLQCYKRMCKFILTSGILHNWRLNNLSSSRKLQFATFVYEGAALEDNYHYLSNPSIEPIETNFPTSIVAEYQTSASQTANGRQSPVHSTELDYVKSPKVVLKRTPVPLCALVAYYGSTVIRDSAATRSRKLTKMVNKDCSCCVSARSKKVARFGRKCPCSMQFMFVPKTIFENVHAADEGCYFCWLMQRM